MQWDIAPTCSMKVTVDTPTEAQSVQTCDPGALQTVIRRTSKRIDDQTVTTDTEMTKGGQQITATHTTLEYLGACPAGITSLSGVPKPSAEECARLPEMREQVKAATCHSGALPAAYVAQCEAAMKTMQVNMQQLEGICKK